LLDATYPVLRCVNGQFVEEQVPALSALNLRLRNDYVQDAGTGVVRWNRVIEKAGFDFRLKLPHVAFYRHIGEFASIHTDPDGNSLSAEDWAVQKDRYLPNDADADYITSLMVPVAEPGKYAGWIAAPKLGIDNKPGDFEYVQIVA
jgi:benzoyl-CoA 2,3-dioxygenase component B